MKSTCLLLIWSIGCLYGEGAMLPQTKQKKGPSPSKLQRFIQVNLQPSPKAPPKVLTQVPTLLSVGTINAPIQNIEALLNQLPTGQLTAIGPLLSKTGKEPRYIAVGGSITAGFRNGGLYREAQITAYPNLLARQMGLTNFKMPLFPAAQGNGSGYKKLVPGGSFPQYKDVTDNMAVVGNDPPVFIPFNGDVDNLGFPLLGIHSSFATETWRFDDRIAPGVPYEPAFRPYFRRILPDDNQKWSTSYLPYVLQQKADFISIELGMDDAIWFATAGGYRLNGVMTQLAMGEGSPIITLLNQIKVNNIKGVITTVPDVLAFPYFKFYPTKTVRQLVGGNKLYAVVDDRYDLVENGTQYVAEVLDTDILLPSIDVNALTTGRMDGKGLSANNPLSSRNVLSAHEIAELEHVNSLNALIQYQAKLANVPVVDLGGIYKKILAGTYVTDDGLAIDPAFPTGNFFSSDGLQPTALGQAVIANEYIKVINQYYQTSIPLIQTKLFSKLING